MQSVDNNEKITNGVKVTIQEDKNGCWVWSLAVGDACAGSGYGSNFDECAKLGHKAIRRYRRALRKGNA